jgi:hypothetical protein
MGKTTLAVTAATACAASEPTNAMVAGEREADGAVAGTGKQ